MTLHCAFIGFGKSTTRYHLPYVLNRKNSWHVAHIFRRHAKPEEQAPIYSHIHFTSDLDEVLNDPDVKLVVVCTHADSHFEYAKRALEAGKNVLVEKPFTPTIAQAKELFALAKSSVVKEYASAAAIISKVILKRHCLINGKKTRSAIRDLPPAIPKAFH